VEQQALSLVTVIEVMVLPLLLGLALVYGVVMYRRRSQAQKQMTEERSRQLYARGAEQERREG